MLRRWTTGLLCRSGTATASDGSIPGRIRGILQFLREFNVSTKPAGPLVCVALYVAGILNWVHSFAFANLAGLDWRLTLVYEAILKEALRLGQLPYCSTFLHYTNRYLGTPETPFSPQFLLLPWFDAWSFNLLNLCFLYSLSFVGLLLLKRRYALSWVPFTLMYLLFNFSGCIVARVAVGHTMWYGYFFLPFFYLCLFDILENRNEKRATYLLAGVLFLMELQGSFHLLVWCCMFLGLVALLDRPRFRPLAEAVVWTFALCAFRFVPAAVSLHGVSLFYFPSFQTAGALLDGLTIHLAPPVWEAKGYLVYSHEGNHYVGFAGLTLLIIFAWIYPYRYMGMHNSRHWALSPAILVMTILSLNPVWRHVYDLGIPLLNSQRIPARFLVIPITASIFIAAPHIQRFLEDPRIGKRLKWLVALALVPVALGLQEHSATWTVRNIEVLGWEEPTTYLPQSLVIPDMTQQDVRLYVHVLWASMAFSAVAGVLWSFLLFRAHLSGAPLRSTSASTPVSSQTLNQV